MKQRELKFRAWSEQRKAFVKNCYPCGSGENYGFDLCGVIEDGDQELEDDGLVLMQYTGFKDKNCKDIYEGDIVNIEKIDGKKYNAQVVFFNGAFCILTNNGYFDKSVMGHNVLIHIDYDWEEYRPFYEVIGNIYENYELLK